MDVFAIYSIPKAQGTPQKRGLEENIRTRTLKEGLCTGCVTANSHDLTAAVAAYRHKTGPVNSQWVGEWLIGKAYPFNANLLASDGFRERGRHCICF